MNGDNRRNSRRGVSYGIALAAHLGLVLAFLVNPFKATELPPDSITVSLVSLPPAPKPEPVVEIKQPEPTPPTLQPPPPRPAPVKHRVIEAPGAPSMSAVAATPPVPPQPVSPAPASAPMAPPQTYISELYAHLARYKHYPRAAQVQHEQGVAYLRFTMDRQGKVLAYRLERGSGYADLDREVEAMIQRAQPLPPLPADMPDQVEMVIPVQFSLR